MGLDIMGLMNDKSKAQATQKYETKEINIGQIIENPANSKIYTTDDIGRLADSIEMAGRVLQNLVVKPADENGKYMLISGHRRLKACNRLVSRGKLEFGNVQCLIENEEDEDLQELMLIYTNSTARDMNDAEKARQAERATAILTKMKQEKKLEGRVRDIAANMLKTTSGQLARYHAIMNNLKDEELQQAFNSGKIGVSVAYEASGLSEEGQHKIALQMRDGSVTLQDVTVKKMEERAANDPEWNERMERVKRRREGEEDTGEQGEKEADKRDKLEIVNIGFPKSTKIRAKIYILQNGEKFYSAYEYTTNTGGAGSHPDARYDKPFENYHAALRDALNNMAKRDLKMYQGIKRTTYGDLIDKPQWKEHQMEAWRKGNDSYWHFRSGDIRLSITAKIEPNTSIQGKLVITCAVQEIGHEMQRYEILREDFDCETDALNAAVRHVAGKNTQYAEALEWYTGDRVAVKKVEREENNEDLKKQGDKERTMRAAACIIGFLQKKIEEVQEELDDAKRMENEEGEANYTEVIAQLELMIEGKKIELENIM